MYQIIKVFGMAAGLYPKIWRVMKLTTIILLITLMQVSAATLAQRITLNKTNTNLSAVLNDIRKQSGYGIFYDSQTIPETQKINIHVTEASLDDALKAAFDGLALEYSIDGKIITIKKQEPSFFDKVKAAFKNIDVTGRVVDETGKPVPGATVKTMDGKAIAVTNENGYFLLKGVEENTPIIITYIGFTNTSIAAIANVGTITLTPANTKLDETVIVGYGTTTKRLTTGAQTQVKGATIERQPQSNPILGLQGQVSGLLITPQSGVLGADVNVTIRGINNMQQGLLSPPLYIIDGVPFNGTALQQADNRITTSPLNTLNTDNIESISVLKDADATAIYGARGANGVILITTKKGKAGDTQFQIDLSSGVGKATTFPQLANTEQYLNVRRQAFANDGITPNANNAPDLMAWSPTAYTDMAKLIAGQTARQNNLAFSLSGGSEQTQFRLGADLYSQSSILYDKGKDVSQKFNLNLQHKSINNKLGLSLAVDYNLDNNSAVPAFIFNPTLPPNYPLYNADGSLYWAPGFTNPLGAFLQTNIRKTSNFNSNAVLHYTILPGLDLKASMGYNKTDLAAIQVQPAASQSPAFNPQNTSMFTDNVRETYIVEPQLTYDHTWKKHKFSALLGGTWQETMDTMPYYMQGVWTNPALATSPAGLPVNQLYFNTSRFSDYKYLSGFSRLSYQYADKYLLNVNMRRDGSSRFGADRQFGNFGSIGAAWIFSEERFMKKAMPWLSYGKIKASYGAVGSDNIQDYQFESLYYIGSVYGTSQTYRTYNIANPYLQWESTRKLDLGLSLGFFDSRLLVDVGVYRNRSSSLLYNQATASQTGFASFLTNIPAVIQNKGLEVEITSTNIRTRAFSWSTSLNLTVPQNKLISFPYDLGARGIQPLANNFLVGQPLTFKPLYHFTGFVNGIPTVQDANNDGKITSGYASYGQGDMVNYVNPDPKMFGGLSNTFTYKGFELNILLYGVSKHIATGSVLPGTPTNLPLTALDVPFKYTTNYASPAATAWFNYTASDGVWGDGSFVRLRNLSFAYNFNTRLTDKLKMKNLQVYLRGQNLFTVTSYKYGDPESGALPPMKLILAGIKATF